MIRTINNTHRLTVVTTTVLATIIISLMLLLIAAPLLARIGDNATNQTIRTPDVW